MYSIIFEQTSDADGLKQKERQNLACWEKQNGFLWWADAGESVLMRRNWKEACDMTGVADRQRLLSSRTMASLHWLQPPHVTEGLPSIGQASAIVPPHIDVSMWLGVESLHNYIRTLD